jgi:hypothetical protein
MMSTMTSRSDIIRAGATPEFVQLCKALYGDVIDADAVWQEVAKSGPDQADVNAHGSSGTKQFLRATAITGGVLGGALGVKEGVHGVQAARSSIKAGEKVTRSAKKSMAIAGTLGVTDSIELGVLGQDAKNDFDIHRNKNRGQLKPTRRTMGIKAARGIESIFPAMGDLINGTKKVNAEVTGTLVPKHRAPTAGAHRAPTDGLTGTAGEPGKLQQGGKAATNAVRSGFTTKQGAATMGIGAVGGAGLIKAGQKKNSGGGDMFIGGKRDVSNDIEWSGTFSKFDSDKHLAFGWASVSKVNGLPVVDKQGDYIDPDDLESAAYEYVLKSRVGGSMHQRDENDRPVKVADIVESMVFTDDKVAKMGLPDNFNRGWWVGMKVHDEDTWSEVRKGGRTGFSIHGKGIRKDQSVDELMSYR